MNETTEFMRNMKRGPENTTTGFMNDMRNEKMKELEEKKAELQIAKLQAEINKLTAQDKSITRPAYNLISAVIAQEFSDPKRRTQFLKELDEESIGKIGLLLSSEDPRGAAVMGMLKSPTTNFKDIIEIVKLVTPPQKQAQASNQTSLKDIAEVFKLGIEAAKSNKGQPESMQEGFKYVFETFVKPFQESLSTKDKEVMDAKLESIKKDIQPPLVQQIAGIKAIAGELGFTNPGGKNTADLRLEEMRQNHDLDMERLRWEQQKFMLQSDAERDKWGAIQNTFAPVFAMAAPELRSQLSKLGNEVGKTLGQPSTNPKNSPPQKQNTVAPFTCPKCSQKMNVPYPLPPGVKGVKCSNCGTETSIQFQGEDEKKPQTSEKPPEEAPQIHSLKPHYR